MTAIRQSLCPAHPRSWARVFVFVRMFGLVLVFVLVRMFVFLWMCLLIFVRMFGLVLRNSWRLLKLLRLKRSLCARSTTHREGAE